jgi:hypothetical protein
MSRKLISNNMKKIFLISALIISNIIVFGQVPNTQFFSDVEKILNKAEGEEVAGSFDIMVKIGKQIFRFDSVSVETRYKRTPVTIDAHPEIDWIDEDFYYFLGSVKSKGDKIKSLNISMNSVTITLYFLSKDFDILKKLLEKQWPRT